MTFQDGAAAENSSGRQAASPGLEVLEGGEDVGQQEVEERPQLRQVVLQRRACGSGTTRSRGDQGSTGGERASAGQLCSSSRGSRTACSTHP